MLIALSLLSASCASPLPAAPPQIIKIPPARLAPLPPNLLKPNTEDFLGEMKTFLYGSPSDAAPSPSSATKPPR